MCRLRVIGFPRNDGALCSLSGNACTANRVVISAGADDGAREPRRAARGATTLHAGRTATSGNMSPRVPEGNHDDHVER
jgi:hypothetical protein